MKVFGLPKVAWSFIFFVIQVINFAFLVAAMNYDYWFQQRWSFPGGLSLTFKGSLLGPYSNYNLYCTDTDSYDTCYENCLGHCDLYKIWYGAGVSYVVLDSLASVIVVIIGAILVLDFMKVRVLRKLINLLTTAILMGVVAGLHFLAFVMWAVDCETRISSTARIVSRILGVRVCAGMGGWLLLFGIWFICVVSVLGTLLLFEDMEKKRRKMKSKERGSYLLDRSI